jgi:hypothetical protein
VELALVEEAADGAAESGPDSKAPMVTFTLEVSSRDTHLRIDTPSVRNINYLHTGHSVVQLFETFLR